MASPTAKRLERRTTTTVPLKDEDASVPPRRRGRPRKSDAATTTPKAKRPGTPRRKKAALKTSDAATTEAPTEASPKKKRGRPRKSIPPEPEPEEVITNEAPPPESSPFEEISTEAAEAFVRFADAAQPESSEPSRVRRRTPSFDEGQETGRITPPGVGLNKRIRSRKGTPHAKVVKPLSLSSDADEGDILTPSESEEEAARASANSRQFSHETDEPHTVPEFAMDDDEEQIADATNYAFDEGTTRMPDDTTVMESAEFSMISVQSLPSYGALNTPYDRQRVNTPMSNMPAAVTDESERATQPEKSSSSRSARNVSRLADPLSANNLLTTDEPLVPEPSVPSQRERQKTPAGDSRSPSQPPALEPPFLPVPNSARSSESPEMGRALKAGVALQGLLEPDRVSPAALTPAALTPAAIRQRTNSFDDLFRGFSEGTRKEMQAGLRLGQQLALHRDADDEDELLSSPPKAGQSRLLTPEEQEEPTLAVPPALTEAPDGDVHYPTLRVQDSGSHLISPAMSDEGDEMSWQVDTPPVRIDTQEPRSAVTAINPQGELIRGQDVYLETEDRDGRHIVTAVEERGARISGPEIYVVSDKAEKQDYSDIWAEMAGRSPAPAARVASNPSEERVYPRLPRLDRGKSRMSAAEEQRLHSDFSEASEASGIFFQPRQRRYTNNERRQNPQTIGEELLMDDGQSLISESPFARTPLQNEPPKVASSPPEMEQVGGTVRLDEGKSLPPQSSPAAPLSSKPNPFVDTPPHFPPVRSSPVKSSPLRQEYRASDTEESFQQGNSIDESSLPVSSPFRTQVDLTGISAASDEKQLRQEMEEGVTDPSLRNLREEADARAEAYDFQDRTLQDITEVTERSRTLQSAAMPSSPPLSFLDRNGDSRYREDARNSTLLDAGEPLETEPSLEFLEREGESDYRYDERHAKMLFGDTSHTERSDRLAPREPKFRLFEGENEKSSTASKERMTAHEPIIARAPRVEEAAPEPSSTSLFSRLTSGFWGSRNEPTPPTEPTAEMPPKGRLATRSSVRISRTDQEVSSSASSPQSRPHRRGGIPTRSAGATAQSPDPPEAAARSNRVFTQHYSSFTGRAPPSNITTPPSRRRAPPTRDTRLAAPTTPTTPSRQQAPATPTTPRSTFRTPQRVPNLAKPITTPNVTPPRHPVTSQLPLLPKVEPWTRTHYLILDRLYKTHLRHPSLFSPLSTNRSSVAPTNAAILLYFLSHNPRPFVGARYTCWGYEVTMTESLVVLAAAFQQLMLCDDMDEYRRFCGEEIDVGDCGPLGPDGTPIDGAEVVRRLATLIMGIELRAEEARGVRRERRERDMRIVWPEE